MSALPTQTLVWGTKKQQRHVESLIIRGTLHETLLTTMIKSAFVALAATAFTAGSAMAGPYVNVETNAGYTGSDYDAATTDLHVGYEDAIGESASWYVQAGPALVAVDGEETTTEFSGKAGLGVDVTESINLYGEISFITVDGQDDNSYGTKVGVKYTF